MAKRIPKNSGVPESATDLLVGYYRRAQQRMAEMILHPKGLTTGSIEFRRARAASQIAQVDVLLTNLKGAAAAWVGKEMLPAYQTGIDTALAQAKAAGVTPDGQAARGDFSLIDRRSVEVLARDAAADLYKSADAMADRTARLLRKTAQIGLGESEINRILAGGVIEGTPRDTIRELKAELVRVNNGQLVTVIDKNGDPIEFEAGYYAAMVARTKTREAVEVARSERLQSVGIDLVIVVGAISNHFCTAFLGQIFSLSGNDKRYPALDSLPGGGPPFHPNCSKSTRPYVEELATDAQREAGAPDPDVAKLVGLNQTQAARAFKDLQLRQVTEQRFKTLQRSSV